MCALEVVSTLNGGVFPIELYTAAKVTGCAQRKSDEQRVIELTCSLASQP